eukprot:4737379-Pyramimonas_sp.AAC.1
MAGLAYATASPVVPRMLRTRPHCPPTTTTSPTLRQPRVTSTVARAPWPRSTCDSTVTASAS